MDRRRFAISALALAGGGLFAARAGAASREDAAALYRRAVVIDGNLVPPIDPDAPLDAETLKGVRASGLTALKASIGGPGSSYAETLEEMGAYDRAIARNPELFLQVRTVADIARAKRDGRVGIIYSFESVEMLEGGLARIDEFAGRGVRVMQLSYNKVSPFAAGVLAPQPSAGLTPLGREAIARMNALGITLDLSHADERSTLEAIKATRRTPLITHAGCAAIHAHPRNKSDTVLKALADRGGVIGIYDLSFLTAGPGQPKLDDYLDHMAHALKLCGEDHVGVGSDALMTGFDTSPASMKEWDEQIAARKASGVGAPGEGRPPYVEGLNSSDRCAVIAGGLLKRGYGARVVEKVLGSNFQRVFAETWTVGKARG